MANAAVAMRDDEALFYNPAQIGLVRSASIAWQRAGDATLRAASAVFRADSLGVGVGARHLDLDAADLPLSAPLVGDEGPLPASSLAIVAGAARPVKGVRVGAVVGYGEDRVGDQRSGHTVLDVGVARSIIVGHWPRGVVQVGLALQHLGGRSTIGDTKVYPPTSVTAGANLESYPLGSFDIAGGVALSVRRDGRVVPRTGWELSWFWIDGYAVQARAGVRRPEFDGQSAITLGLGLLRDNISLDYAFEPARDIPESHRVGIRVR
jgi:hypothetical protein